MFETRKVPAALHALSIPAALWEEVREPRVPYGVEYGIWSRKHWPETPSASLPQACSMGRSWHCSSSSSCLSRCQELWVDASSQHLVQGDILTVALSPAHSHSSKGRQDRRKRFIFPQPVCPQGRWLQPTLPLSLIGVVTRWEKLESTGPHFTLSERYGQDKLHPCGPCFSLLAVWRPDQKQTSTPALWISTVDPIKPMCVWPQWSQHHTEHCVSMGICPHRRGPGSYRTARSISLEGPIPFSQGHWWSTLQALMFANEPVYIIATVITTEMELS